MLSPRIRITHDASPRLRVHVEYARLVEQPDWASYFANTNSDNTFTDVRNLFGRDVGFGVTSLFEGGVRTPFGSSGVIDVVLFHRNLVEYVGRFANIPDPNDPTRIWVINVLTLIDDHAADGVETKVTWERGWLRGAVAYSVVRVGTARPNEDILLHGVALAAALRGTGALQGFSAHALGRLQSGEPYTRLENTGAGVLTPFLNGRPIEPVNASRTPWTALVDLRVARSIRLAGREWSIYVDARNLLNRRNVLRLFAETGATENARHRTQIVGDPTIGTGEFGALWNEANEAGALGAGNTVNLSSCAGWGSPANCVALTRVERRFGDGDGQFTFTEQERAFNAYYDDFFGSWRLYAPGRTIRLGLSLAL